MPIQDAVKIIREGAGSHFDKKITDVFLSAPVDKILDIIMFENNTILDIKSRKILEKYSLSDMENINNNEQKTREELEAAETFNRYYLQQS